MTTVTDLGGGGGRVQPLLYLSSGTSESEREWKHKAAEGCRREKWRAEAPPKDYTLTILYELDHARDEVGPPMLCRAARGGSAHRSGTGCGRAPHLEGSL